MSNIYVITAPSGAGKTTIAQAIARYGEWQECISHTTRKMREGEVDGKTYYFVDRETFALMSGEHEFAEQVTYNNNRYGISKAEIERVMKTGKDIYIIAEFHGYEQIKNIYPKAIGIFLYMSKEDCLANMLLRGDKINDALERISFYDGEIKNRVAYDYVIKNVRGKQYETETVIRAILKQYRENKFILDSGGLTVRTDPMDVRIVSTDNNPLKATWK
jgi:guanylate kinase